MLACRHAPRVGRGPLDARLRGMRPAASSVRTSAVEALGVTDQAGVVPHQGRHVAASAFTDVGSRAASAGRRRPSPQAAPLGVSGAPAMAVAARAPNTSPSSSELLARRLAPCTRVHATSPAANRPGDRRAPGEVGVDAAAHVVRRRADRQQVARRSRARPAAGVGDAGKTRAHPRRVQVRQRQIDRAPGAFGLAHHRGGDDVARREIAAAVVARS